MRAIKFVLKEIAIGAGWTIGAICACACFGFLAGYIVKSGVWL